MRNIVKALRAIGYHLVVSTLTEEEKTVWSSMVASATSEQQVANLSPEEKTWWSNEIESVSCLNCAYNGQQFCYWHK